MCFFQGKIQSNRQKHIKNERLHKNNYNLGKLGEVLHFGIDFPLYKIENKFFLLFSSARLPAMAALGAHRYLNFLDDAKVVGYQIDPRVDFLHCLLGLTLW